jgi:hypothetical protein
MKPVAFVERPASSDTVNLNERIFGYTQPDVMIAV